MTIKQQLYTALQAIAAGATLAVILTPLFALGQYNGAIYCDINAAINGALLTFCAGFIATIYESLRQRND